jgi:tetratricopeptide (TPR) repeat protein
MPKRKKLPSAHAPRARWATFLQSALRLRVLAGAAIIVVAAFLAYIPSVSGGFILDDDLLVTNNRVTQASDGLYRFWCSSEPSDYWPVTNNTFWIEWRLWGMNSTGYHVTNLILHIVEALLIWTILRKLSIPGAFLAAMIVSVHPVNVESVAWIAQRKNMMAMLFFLMSVLWYLKASMYAASAGTAPGRSHGEPWERERTFSSFILHPSSFHFWYWLSFAAFVLAILSKGSVIVLPVLILGIIWWLRPLTRQDLMRTAPFFLVAGVLTVVNMWFQSHASNEVIRNAGYIERLLDAGCVVWFYLYKVIWPFDLAFIYPNWNIDTGNALWWLPLLAVLAVTAALWRYRSSWSRPLLFAWGYFCVALAPVMGFVDVGFMKYSLVADHYQHISIISAIALTSAGWSEWHYLARNAAHWATAIAVVTVGTFAFLTYQQNEMYRDAITLYQDTLVKNPECWIAQNNLGVALFHAGQLQAPIELYEQAIKLNPDDAPVHNNLGMAMHQAGRYQEAIKQYEQALSLRRNYPEAHNNLGITLYKTGRLPEAIEHYREVLRLEPDYADAHSNLAVALAQTGRFQEAIEQYRQALQLKPDDPEYLYNLGNALVKTDQLKEGIKQYEQALRFKPDNPRAHSNMGGALIKLGRPEEAIEHLKKALQLMPEDVSTWNNLAMAYAKKRQSSEAVAAAQKALELARSQGQTALAKQIENWLKSYSASQSESPK